MPVVNTDEILADALRLDQLPLSRYALVMYICATTRLQLNLDSDGDHFTRLGMDVLHEPRLTTEMLLGLAEDAHRQSDLVKDLGVGSVATSYFLFATYASLEKLRHAWLYLNQSITLPTLLGLDCESGYCHLSESDAAVGRVMNDLVNHISIFEALPPALYEWHSQDNGEPSCTLALASQIDTKLRIDLASTSVIESQRLDTLLTQNWLRVAMWRLVFGNTPSISRHTAGLLIPFSTPVDAGRSIMESLHSVTQISMDCHGRTIEQKLCDVGVSLADTALASGPVVSSFEIGPRDVLCAVVKSVYSLREGQSHLLPKLLKHAEVVLGYGDPAAQMHLQWPLGSDPAGPKLIESWQCGGDGDSPAVRDVTDMAEYAITEIATSSLDL
ncbi:hypothetical protein ACJ41O_005955 [Fusarium nematophilum]